VFWGAAVVGTVELARDVELTRTAERLIARHVDSVGALDLLLLLHGGRDRDWSLDEVCAALRCPRPWATGQLERLLAAGLVAEVAPGRLRYQRGRRYGPAVDEIARVCRTNRAGLIRLVFARPRVLGAG
jgi:hypothetical protein